VPVPVMAAIFMMGSGVFFTGLAGLPTFDFE